MIVYGVAGLHTQYDLIGNSHTEDIIGLIHTAIETWEILIVTGVLGIWALDFFKVMLKNLGPQETIYRELGSV